MAPGVTPKDIYLQLRQDGASEIQALGIMANMMNESGLDPEAVNPAGPQSGVGLVQWQTTDYPHAATLVTGHPLQDMQAQIRFLALTGGFNAAQGTNAGQAAGNFAANYEKCATCQPGGAQFQARVANTLTLAGWAKSGNWPRSVGGGARIGPGAIGTSPGPGSTPDCLWKIDLNIPLIGGNVCLLTKSEARALIGAGILLAGGMLGLATVAVLAATVGVKAAGPVGAAAEGVGGAVALIPGAEPAGLAIAGAGAAAKKAGKGQAAGVARRRQARQAREERAQQRRLGEPRENPGLEVRGGAVRQDRRQQAAQRSRARRAAGQGRPASRDEAGF
jgi:tail lysozyme